VTDSIAPDVERFIRQHINSVEQLEVLLFLRRTAPKDWTGDEVARELRRAPPSIARRFEDLRDRGLAAIVDADRRTYRFAPRDPEMKRVVSILADTYATRHVSVISLIYAESVDSIRNFADAFRIYKKDKDG
jgi:hypothetical protein